jgi:hypothetical protein
MDMTKMLVTINRGRLLIYELISKIIIIFLLSVFLGTNVMAEDCPLGFKRPSYKTRSAYCSTGEYVKDAYNFGKKILCEQMEVDHLIPLKIAHCAGLSQEQLKQFANDPRNLRFTAWQTNRTKGAKDLHTFVQTLNPELRKKVLLDGVRLMQDYKIPVGPQLTKELTRLASLAGPLGSNASKLLATKREALLKRMSRRVVTSMARGVAAVQPQVATGILTPMALAMIAWEVHDACQQLADLNELKKIDSNRDSIVEQKNNESACGMSKSELFQSFTGKDADFEKCVSARLLTGVVDPQECQDYLIEIPHGKINTSNKISLELPHNQ